MSKEWNTGAIASLLKNLAVAAIAVLIIIIILFAYSGIWPPLVVVESESMQHSSSQSYLGTIDTGDMVLVRDVNNKGDVETYIQGTSSGHGTYRQYGDVIVYYRYGNEEYRPIIHRAICWVEYNHSGGGFDIPGLAQLPQSLWDVIGHTDVYWNLNGIVELYDIGYMNATIRLDINHMLSFFQERGREPHSGFITMGDHNLDNMGTTVYGVYDQLSLCREPVSVEWIVGKARGEIPWFGLVKLWVDGDMPESVPSNSVTNLWVSLGLIVGVPIALDAANTVLKRRGIEIFGWTARLSPKKLVLKIREKLNSSQEREEPEEDEGEEP